MPLISAASQQPAVSWARQGHDCAHLLPAQSSSICCSISRGTAMLPASLPGIRILPGGGGSCTACGLHKAGCQAAQMPACCRLSVLRQDVEVAARPHGQLQQHDTPMCAMSRRCCRSCSRRWRHQRSRRSRQSAGSRAATAQAWPPRPPAPSTAQGAHSRCSPGSQPLHPPGGGGQLQPPDCALRVWRRHALQRAAEQGMWPSQQQ